MTQHILIAERDADTSLALKTYLESEGYTVFDVDNAADALKLVGEIGIDMAILDVSMFGDDICERIREIQGKTLLPCLLISEKEADCGKLNTLVIQVDHFLIRPCLPADIHARIKGSFESYLEREEQKKNRKEIQLRELTLSLAENRLHKNGTQIPLTRMEYSILLQLMTTPGKVFSKAELYENIFGICFKSDENTIMVHISNLREKIEDNPRKPQYVLTVRGQGYKVEQ